MSNICSLYKLFLPLVLAHFSAGLRRINSSRGGFITGNTSWIRKNFWNEPDPSYKCTKWLVELLREGIWAVCVDEKTSIQARQLEQEPTPVKPNHPVHVAPRYKRQGALQLFAGLSVADGFKYGQTAERKRFVDFQTLLSEIIFPEALRRKVHTLILILDNGTTHAPKQLETWLQEQVRLHHWSLTIKVYWLPTNASWLDQIELWFSVLQRKLLTPNHFHDTQELTRTIMEFIRCENLSPKPIRWTYTVQKLEAILGTI